MARRLDRSRPQAVSALAALLAVAAVALAPSPAHGQGQPNIVFVMTDDQTASSIAVQRNVGLLRAQGATFTRALATYPLCCPSRATYLSGQYSHNHGVLHNAGPFGGYVHFDHSNALPVWLQQAGYRTMHVGRYLNGYGVQNADLTEVPPGWSDWVSAVGDSVFNYERWQTNENGQLFWRPDRPGEHQTDFFGRRAAELVEQAAPSPQPFFLSLTFPAPHSGAPRDPDDPSFLSTPSPAPRHRDAFAGRPLPRPPSFDEADMRRKPQILADRPRLSPEWIAAIQENYQQELESLLSVDDAVGQVLAALQRSGELDGTLIVYTADNGFFHGEHRVASEKVLPYDAGAHIPLILRGPGVPPGLRLGQLVGNIDWAPTILDAAGARAGRLQDGTSLFELLEDPRRQPGRELVLENGVGANGVPMFRALRNERYLWVEHRTTGEYELYDLRRDPYELRNLEDLDSYAPIRRVLSARLRRLQRCRGRRACGASRPRLRIAASCAGGALRLAISGRDRLRVQHAAYYRGTRRLRATRRPPFAVSVRGGAALPGGRPAALRALVTTVDGRRATYDRRVRPCRRPSRSGGGPRQRVVGPVAHRR
jgi:N-acetylglucosamine-6-sulfatase